MSGEFTSVGLGEIKLSREMSDVLIGFGLGSCVGIGLYDPALHMGGLLHAVLPECKDGTDPNPSKYVNSGVKKLLKEMTDAGSILSRLVVRMVGGANMLSAPGFTNTFDIGTRNVLAAHEVLLSLGLKLQNEEVGGNVGRTVRLYISTGRMTIRMMGGAERDL